MLRILCKGDEKDSCCCLQRVESIDTPVLSWVVSVLYSKYTAQYQFQRTVNQTVSSAYWSRTPHNLGWLGGFTVDAGKWSTTVQSSANGSKMR